MKIYENYERKKIENKKIWAKALKDINEVDHINFLEGNKIEKLNFSQAKVLQVLLSLWIQEIFWGNRGSMAASVVLPRTKKLK